ncbi:MAG: endonuclease/exonuclease/phosphatase family protein [Pirellulales bacterium]|nr:endonuclease/exonuclease/phosphatase family protein [Pirellulales bacterium]
MKKSHKIVMAIIMVVFLVGWAISQRVESPPDSGRGMEADAAVPLVPKRKLRIGTFNIHRCEGDDERCDVARVAKLLEGMDVVGLNEVAGNSLWGATCQTEELGGRLEMAWLFSPVSTRLLDGDFGNGILTKLPVRSWQKIPLPYNGSRRSVRAALLVVLETGDRPINLLLAHLDHRDKELPGREGHKQLDTVISLFLALAEPAILMGDFNAFPNDPLIKELQNTQGVTEVIAEIGADAAPRRVDWIFIRGMRATNAAAVENDASDHPIVWADVEIQPESEKPN